MATTWKAPTWRMPNEKNQSKFENYALTFDGTEYINCGNDSILSNTFTGNSFSFSVWINSISNASYDGIINNGAQVQSFLHNNKIKIWLKASSGWVVQEFTSNATISSNTWYNIIFVRNGNNNTLYINGSLDNTTTSTASIVSTTGNLYIGSYQGSQYYFEGSISEVAIFDYALSSTQVSSLYNSGSPINPMTLKPAPITYYPLGGNASTGGDPLTATTPNTLSVPNVAVPDASVFDFPSLTSGDYIDTNYNLDGLTSFTVSAWFNTDNVTGNPVPIVSTRTGAISASKGFDIYIAANGLYWRVYNNGATQVLQTFTNTTDWQHVVLTYDGSVLRAYLNGSLVNSATGSYITSDANMLIGKWNNGANYFDGQISNVQVWGNELALSDIETLYNNGQPLLTGTQPQEANLKAWYKLNQSANWEADTTGEWQIPDAVSSYPQSFNFDNSNTNYISVANDNSINFGTNDHTISSWINVESLPVGGGQFRTIFSKRSASTTDYQLSIGQNGIIYSYNGSATCQTGTGVISVGNWFNVVLRCESNTIQIYVNGVSQTLTGTTTSGSANTEPLIIGNRGSSPNVNEGFLGKISNIQLWASALPATGTDSIETLYNNGVPLTTAIATDNLKAWYKLNDNEKFDGTNWSVENQKYPAGFDSALSFPASDDYISIGSTTLGINTAIAISAWVKTSVNTGYGVIIGEDNAGNKRNWTLTRKNDDIVFTIHHDDTGTNFTSIQTSTINVSDNKWHHVVGAWDGTTNTNSMKVYFDGVEVGQDTPSSTGINTEAAEPWIGNSTNNPSGYNNWTGELSNIAVYNTGLDSSAVTALYNNGTPETSISSSPVSWWKLNNLTTGIQDSVGSNNGTNNGATKVNTFVSTEAGISSGMTEQNLVNNNVSALNGESSGMDTSNLVTSTLTRQVPYNSYSLYFDGTSDYVEVPDDASLKPNSAITCSMWFNCGIQNTNRNFLSKYYDTVDGAYGFYTNGSSSDLYFYVTVGGTTYDSPVGSGFFDDNWHHAVGVYDGTYIYLYVDGVQQGTSTELTGSISYNEGILCFASLAGSPTSYEVDTYLSNISIFNEALTSTEILKLYNSGVPSDLSTFNPQPVSWWSLGSDSYFNGSNYICPDLIGTNNSNASNGLSANSLVGKAPNSSANGTSTNMTYDANLTGSAPNSSNNSFSVNMSYDDRVSGTGNVPG